MDEKESVADLAMAHMRLTQTIRGMRPGSEAYKATDEAIIALAKSILGRARSGMPRYLFEKKHDWVETTEDVSSHCMSGEVTHVEDGRECRYHTRLDAWVFDVVRGQNAKKCLRGNHELIMNHV